MRDKAGRAAAPAARCKNCLRWGSFISPSPAPLLNHLVSSDEQSIRYFEAKRLRGLEVDHELELCRQHNRQITRLLAFEDASGINAGLTVCIGNAGRVAHQAAGLDKIALD